MKSNLLKSKLVEKLNSPKFRFQTFTADYFWEGLWTSSHKYSSIVTDLWKLGYASTLLTKKMFWNTMDVRNLEGPLALIWSRNGLEYGFQTKRHPEFGQRCKSRCAGIQMRTRCTKSGLIWILNIHCRRKNIFLQTFFTLLVGEIEGA